MKACLFANYCLVCVAFSAIAHFAACIGFAIVPDSLVIFMCASMLACGGVAALIVRRSFEYPEDFKEASWTDLDKSLRMLMPFLFGYTLVVFIVVMALKVTGAEPEDEAVCEGYV